MLTIDTNVQELRCPSKFKKLGINPSSSSIKRKNLVRWKMQHSMCLKHRSICDFSVLENHQKEILLEYTNVHSYQCILPLCPNNDFEHAHLDFGTNNVETNHYASCGDKTEINIDHVLPLCEHCSKEAIGLDDPKGNRLMCNNCLKGKKLFRRGEVKLIRTNAQKIVSRKHR